MPAFKKENCRFHLDPATGENISSHGGQIIVDSLAIRFDLWNSLAAIPGLDPRKRLTTGFTPTAVIAQMMVGFTSGAASLADMERVGSDRVLMDMGLTKGAGQGGHACALSPGHHLHPCRVDALVAALPAGARPQAHPRQGQGSSGRERFVANALARTAEFDTGIAPVCYVLCVFG